MITASRWWGDFLALRALLLAGFVTLILTSTNGARAASLADSTRAFGVKELYLKYCAGCHGESGTGNGPKAASFRAHLQSFADCERMEMRSDAVLFLIIQNGSASIELPPGMPAFGGLLTEDQIASLIRYIRDFCRSKSRIDASRDTAGDQEW